MQLKPSLQAPKPVMFWQSNWGQLSPNQLHVGLAGIAAQRSADMHSLVRAAFSALGGMTTPSLTTWGSFSVRRGEGGRGARCRWARGRGRGKGGVPWILCIFLGIFSFGVSHGGRRCKLRLEMIPDPGRTPEGTG
ncbi:hypothetical protein J3F84DRAFT_386003 [Trichoderma pleuroticola]